MAKSVMLENMVREGIVSVVYPERHSARVTFPDKGNLVSAELPVLTLNALKNKSYSLPDVGERVIVLMTSNDDTAHGGYILGSLYTGENLPQVNSLDTYSLKFSDEAEFSYKRVAEKPESAEDKTARLNIKMADTTQILYESNNSLHQFHIKFGDGCTIEYEYGQESELNIKFADGSTISHNRRGLEMDIKGEINISANGEINIATRQDMNLNGANIHLN